MKLNNLFTDGAVFQRRMPIPVFGKTDPNSKVEITFDGMNFYGMAGEDGSFLVRMSAKEAGGPYILTVRNTRTNDFQEVKNILIGEVWLASGQSNMEFTMNSSPIQKKQFECEMVNCDSVRMFTVPKRAS